MDCTRARLPIVSLRKLYRTMNEAPAKPRTVQAARAPTASAGEKTPPTSHEGSPTSAHRVRCPDQYVGSAAWTACTQEGSWFMGMKKPLVPMRARTGRKESMKL